MLKKEVPHHEEPVHNYSVASKSDAHYPWAVTFMTRAFSPKLLPDEALELIATRFKALSESGRLKLIIALQQGEKNVTDLVKATGKGQTNVSRQLQHLVEAGVLARRREGARVYYSIADPAIFDLCHHVCGSLHKQLQERGKASAFFRI